MIKKLVKIMIIFSILLFTISISFATNDTIENTNIESYDDEERIVSYGEMDFNENGNYAEENFSDIIANKTLIEFNEGSDSEIKSLSLQKSSIKVPTTISYNYANIYQTEKLNLVLYGDGSLLSNRQVAITINNVVYYRTTDANGIASITINLNAQSSAYYVSYSYAGDSAYNAYSGGHNLYVFLKQIKLTPYTQYVHQGNGFKVKVTDNDFTPVANKNVKITVNGQTYERTTDAKGVANLNINLGPGTYSISTLFEQQAGYQSHNAVTKTLQVYAANNNPQTKINLLMDFVQSYFQVQLTTASGTELIGKPVNILLNGVNYVKTTSSNGIASLDINLNSGIYSVVVTFAGDSSYKSTEFYQIFYVANDKAEYMYGSTYNPGTSYDIHNIYSDYTSSYVTNLANELTASSSSTLEKYIALYNHVYRFKTGTLDSNLNTAYQALVFNIGDSSEHSNAFVALCKASDLTVRYAITTNNGVKYVWTQVAMAFFWVVADPATSSVFGQWGTSQYNSNYQTSPLLTPSLL